MGMQKERVRSGLAFHSKAPFEVHSDCEARLDIPVPATKKSQSPPRRMTGFLHFQVIYHKYVCSVCIIFSQSPKKIYWLYIYFNRSFSFAQKKSLYIRGTLEIFLYEKLKFALDRNQMFLLNLLKISKRFYCTSASYI
jgi:hypothetical protein